MYSNFSKLLSLRNETWRRDNNWKPDWTISNSKNIIMYRDDHIIRSDSSFNSRVLAFRTSEIRDKFLNIHQELILKCKELI